MMTDYDDIYVFLKSLNIKNDLEALRERLDMLRENKQYVKLSKCVFCAEVIPCVGDFAEREGVHIGPDKVQTIKKCPVPRTQEGPHSFPGLTKTKPNAKLHFDEEKLKNFKELK
ncbi:DNA/RNA polymerase [Phytophthora megakarya]|uniref:DNA/RNA polymerase n=1 Tax=Phytophthora megakarya TaxID=4795 RepID=A0A225UZ47_9STRA|nr:DNA/RNA polymerase [Phytophthora megakarya]